MSFDDYRTSMRAYRDKFLAHLDNELTMQIPRLEFAEFSVGLYHEVVVSEELSASEIGGLASTPPALLEAYTTWENEARQAYALMLAP